MTEKTHFCIIRYGELALKGQNRAIFERKLVYNLKKCLKLHSLPFLAFNRLRGRIFLTFCGKNIDYAILANVFGVASISFAIESRLEDLEKNTDLLLKNKKFNTFRVTSRRVDKSLSIKSNELDIKLGSYVVENYKKKVSLTNFDLNIGVEAINKKLYVFLDKLPAPGGLPYGIEGTTFAVVKNEQDLLAALLMMKRGCEVIFLTTKPELVKNTCHNYGILPKILKFDKITLKTIEDFAKKEDFDSFIIGRNNLKSNLIEFNPLVGLSEKQIKEKIKLMIKNV
ncbi:hypothetical protein HN695_07310 [Candidatus Woesearchaeota archaeon]|jgi:adenylyl- and sulfurtransferase ThiI|nr:hypothetical protein [Candidatus Woesearchaeota archaeon]MBT6336742.1 hypothetical protein [Candidatus Woesearchaeota archaeon]MBT7928115.1 hypothetical protein [Candidatus Woesearchaeota archaeon]